MTNLTNTPLRKIRPDARLLHAIKAGDLRANDTVYDPDYELCHTVKTDEGIRFYNQQGKHVITINPSTTVRQVVTVLDHHTPLGNN